MRDKKNFSEKPLLHECKKPVTRRDFLSRGFLSGVGLVTAPSLFGAFASRDAYAQAVDCGLALGGAGRIPFICIDLAGGANTASSNVLVGGPGGQLDPMTPDGYMKVGGLPAGMLPTDPAQVDGELGLLFHVDSPFLAGIRTKTSAATRANINGTVICARSENDTDNNPHNPMYGINKAGANGDLVALVGSRNSDSGGKSIAPMTMIDLSVRPTKVSSANDAKGLVDTGQLIDLLDQNQAVAVMDTVEKLSDMKLAKITEQQVTKDLIHCGYAQTTDLVNRYGNPDVLDPNLDPDIGGAGGIFSQGELGESRFRKTAAIMKLVVEGYAGAGTIEQGGYDYHDSTRATGEIRDFLAGQMMGACLEFAARRNQQLMLYVFSDGSVASNGEIDNSGDGRGKGIWKGDNSSTAAVFILVYDPAGRPALSRADASQIGYFRPNGSVETAATRVSNNVALLAECIVLNYLALHDEVGRLAEVLPNHGLGQGAELDSLVAFAPIRTAS